MIVLENIVLGVSELEHTCYIQAGTCACFSCAVLHCLYPRNLCSEVVMPIHVHVHTCNNSLKDGDTINPHQCQVIVKDPEINLGSSWDSNPEPSDY